MSQCDSVKKKKKNLLERLEKQALLLMNTGILKMTINVNKNLKLRIREKMEVFAEQILSIATNSLRYFNILPHMINTALNALWCELWG